MYSLMHRYFSARIAMILLGAWYALLIFLIILFGASPEMTIRYLEL
jgi:hypothetical protein